MSVAGDEAGFVGAAEVGEEEIGAGGVPGVLVGDEGDGVLADAEEVEVGDVAFALECGSSCSWSRIFRSPRLSAGQWKAIGGVEVGKQGGVEHGDVFGFRCAADLRGPA